MTARAWWWAVISATVFVVANIVVALVLVLPLQYFDLVPHPASVGIWAAAWVLLSGLTTFVVGRRIFRLDLRATTDAWLVLAAGALLDALLVVSLIDWAILRLGQWDPSTFGPFASLWHVLAATATAGFAVLIAPRDVALPAVVFVATGAILMVLIVAQEGGAAVDGISDDSWAYASAVGASLAYSIGIAGVSVWKLRWRLAA